MISMDKILVQRLGAVGHYTIFGKEHQAFLAQGIMMLGVLVDARKVRERTSGR